MYVNAISVDDVLPSSGANPRRRTSRSVEEFIFTLANLCGDDFVSSLDAEAVCDSKRHERLWKMRYDPHERGLDIRMMLALLPSRMTTPFSLRIRAMTCRETSCMASDYFRTNWESNAITEWGVDGDPHHNRLSW